MYMPGSRILIRPLSHENHYRHRRPTDEACDARRWHREKADIDDLVQDTVVQALANAHLWQPGTDLRGWLYTIMRNRFLAGVTRSNRSAAALQTPAAP